MRIIYRIIDKNNSDDDCLYELRRKDDSALYWAFMRYTNGNINYPTLHFTSCRNLNGQVDGLAGALIFEEGDLCAD